jgi:dihydropyrimidinase
MDGFADWRRRAENACVDVGAHMIVSDFHDQTLIDMEAMLKRDGVTSFKMFMAVPGRMMLDDGELFRIMRMTGANGGLSCVHAENGLLIEQLIKDALAEGRNEVLNHPRVHPPETEGEAVFRAIQIAKLAAAPIYIVHVSTADAVHSIAEARDGGIPIYAETCPHYLFLTEQEYDTPGWDAAKYTMIPPLRSREHLDALWRGLSTDDLQVVATDHCPFCLSEDSRGREYSKEMFGRESFAQLPNGAPGVETRLPLIFDGGVRQGRFSVNRFVEITATAPAKLFGLFPKKGTIAVASDADLVLFDPAATWTVRAAEHHSRIDYSLYEGREITGRVEKVFLRGELIVDGKKWLGKPGGGEYVVRGPSGILS